MQRSGYTAWYRLCGVLLAVCTALLVIAAAIAVPIVLRPFYYAQTDALKLPQQTGYSVGVIRQAYDQVMDFLVCGKPFGTGALPYSQAGKSHFEDCRTLFQLDFRVLGIGLALTAALTAVRAVLRKKGLAGRQRRLPVFWSAVFSCGVFALLAVWGAISFDSLFVAFHATFFPGKSNWIFDPATDAIINILPETFFLRCAVLIAALIFLVNGLFFAADAVWRGRKRG